jgi:hypothetical protein
MKKRTVKLVTCTSLVLSSAVAHAQTSPSSGSGSAMQGGIQELKQEIAEQGRQLEALKKALAEQEMRYSELRRSLGIDVLEAARGTGPAPSGIQLSQADQSRQPPADNTQRTVRVGSAPERDNQGQAREVPQLFEQPGILTPRGKTVLEPSFQYGYSSTNRVALVGYTVIPALLIGLVDVREVKRNTVTAALTGRFGITNRFEIEAKVPYVYRSDSTISREIFTGTATERVFSTDGRGLGDVEIGARYQLNDGGNDKPYLIGSLRFKSRTGKDPFEVATDCVTRCVGNTTGTGLPLELPTGSGFYSIQPGLTWLFPSDPAVFFGSFTYTHNFKRDNVSRTVIGGQKEFIGTVEPGGIIGMNFGMGLALNEKSSFSIGVDLNSIGPTRQNGVTVPGSVRTQLATMLLGFSYRLSNKTSLSVSVGAGMTRDTPDLTLNVRMPISF